MQGKREQKGRLAEEDKREMLKRSLRKKDGIPRREGPYLIDWMKLSDLRQIIRLEKIFFPEPLTLINCSGTG